MAILLTRPGLPHDLADLADESRAFDGTPHQHGPLVEWVGEARDEIRLDQAVQNPRDNALVEVEGRGEVASGVGARVDVDPQKDGELSRGRSGPSRRTRATIVSCRRATSSSGVLWRGMLASMTKRWAKLPRGSGDRTNGNLDAKAKL